MTSGATSGAITPEIVAAHGLSDEEYDTVLDILGRAPNLTELGVFSAMWSEHCSYKSSKFWLKRLPTEGPQVIQGPGENAGIVDIGDGQAAVFKIESHNHPSFIEPYQGAATGVGGILRDVFTMGARPVANLNALRFGAPDHPKTQRLVSGVVAGIGGYGNCVGVPTVAGETGFDAGYNDNILVNAMTVGVVQADRIFRSAAAGVGNPVVYVGAKTGRDGIHGATMASAEFSGDAEEKRPTVQVGDPFTEKLLLEACLELMATDAVVAIQDMGAAGLTSSSVEMASKGGVGIELDMGLVPQRETDMTAYEIMLSESQERMLMILKPEAEASAREIFEKWELDFAVIGRLTDTERLVLIQGGETVCDIPVPPLATKAPEYERPHEPTPPAPVLAVPSLAKTTLPHDGDLIGALGALIGGPHLCSRRWIWEQYDYLVRGDTVIGPGGDSALVRLEGGEKALALSVDCTPRYCLADPVTGGAQAVAECWRNIVAVGARPLAVTNNMNFGNPERPRIMGQFVGCIEGMRAACLALDFPVVSGNVSLYNETEGRAIPPTPVIGGVGLIADLARAVTIAFKGEGEAIFLIGPSTGELGSSLYLRDVLGWKQAPPPPVDLKQERAAGELVLSLTDAGAITACHDISDGGLAVALAEMAIAAHIGARIDLPAEIPAAAAMFGEDQGRYLVAAADPAALEALASAGDVPIRHLGETRGVGDEAVLKFEGVGSISVSELSAAHEAWMPAYMA